MDIEVIKLIVSSTTQLLLGAGAAYLAYQVGKAQVHKSNEKLKIELYDKRLKIYLEFKTFVEHCTVNDCPASNPLKRFIDETANTEFPFGPEIEGYRKELLANAIALVGIETGAPCVSPPISGSLRGYFPGSTILKSRPEFREWFLKQYKSDTKAYFRPYLDFSKAGADEHLITIEPPALPDPPLIRQRVTKAKANELEDSDQLLQPHQSTQ